jgi:osmoprotectant transport system ATP-binding protein
MQDMLRELLRRLDVTVLLVTHDLDEALYLADHIALLSDGKLIIKIPRAEFLASKEAEVVAYVRAFHRTDKENGETQPV